jgi:nickel-type superoxide dismutase maturation protease
MLWYQTLLLGPYPSAERFIIMRSVEVTGESMLPVLRPGDWLIVRPGARIVPGSVVVARHPRDEDTLIVKRAAHRDEDGWWLESDNQRAPGRQDSWDFGAVPDGLIVGRVVMRYWPRPSLRLGPR